MESDCKNIRQGQYLITPTGFDCFTFSNEKQ
jgi:hypothetical protein